MITFYDFFKADSQELTIWKIHIYRNWQHRFMKFQIQLQVIFDSIHSLQKYSKVAPQADAIQ